MCSNMEPAALVSATHNGDHTANIGTPNVMLGGMYMVNIGQSVTIV